MKNVELFISHSSADGEAAEKLVAELENAGLTCWLASRDVSFGGAYQAEIVDAIDHCRALLLVFSDAANRSEHVLREVELAAQGRKPIFPLRIDRSEPAGGLKYLLANKQWVERRSLRGRLGETFASLLKQAAPPGGEGEKESDGTRARSLRPQGRRAGRSLAVAAVGLVAVGVGIILWFVQGGGGGPKTVVIAAAPAELVPDPVAPAPEVPTSAPAAPAAAPAEPAPGPAAAEPAPASPVDDVQKPPGLQTTSNTSQWRPSSEPPPVVLAAAPPNGGALGPGVYLFKECDVCPVMAVIPPGPALIGSPDHEAGRKGSEGPQQPVLFARAFAVGQSEVSFDEWFACVAEGGCNAHRPGDYGWGHGKRPVINVSWTDAKSYVEWLSRKTGKPYRLLSEAEWEYAARGCASALCASKPFWFGAEISPARANYDWRYSYNASPKGQPPRRTVAGDSGEANPFGLRHVHGNVREWVEDCWNASLSGLPKDGRARSTGDCNGHVTRGGSWADEPRDLRVAARTWEVSNERRAQIGFRVARSLSP
jgi:formylglycine-generating enzyme required for sulfatase activity